MLGRPALAGAALAAASATPGAPSSALSWARRWCRCEQPPKASRAAAASSSSKCSGSRIEYFAARSLALDRSSSFHAVSEKLHQFVIVDGVTGDDGGRECAMFCAQRLTPLAARAFLEQLRQLPLHARTNAETGQFLTEEDGVGGVWAEALTAAAKGCDSLALQEVAAGGCCVLHCNVARSGIYISSLGLGRAVIGTEETPGGDILCDEASTPHSCEDSETERERMGTLASRMRGPTRLLGGAAEKRMAPQLICSPDVVRIKHVAERRYLLLASPGVFEAGPRLPIQWAVAAHRDGKNPAAELVSKFGGDSVALVLVLPPGLDDEDGGLPPHDKLES